MKLPFQRVNQRCYKEVKKAPVLGEGVERMMVLARSGEPFEARLKAVLETRRNVVEEYRWRPLLRESLREESNFVCAADDLLEAMFSGEIDRLRKQGGALDALLTRLNELDLNPQWRDETRPRIAARIAEARK